MDEQPETSEVSVEADRARRLFLYLRDLAELRSKSVRDLADYEKVVWLKDLPAGRHGWSIFDESTSRDDPEVWLQIDRVQLPRVPQPPEALSGWIRRSALGHAEYDEPGLVDPDESEAPIPNDVRQTYADYLSREWRPWQRRYLDLKPAYDFYTTLFSVSERRQSLGEVFELIIGMGLLTWNRNGHRVQRHMITAPAELIIDDDTGAIELRPSDAEGRNRFELDMLDTQDRGPAEILNELNELIEGSDPLELGETTAEALTRWINRSQPEGRFEPTLEPPRASDELTIVLAPAIVLRKRGQRTLSTLLGSIAEQIAGGQVLPEGVARLVTTDKLEGFNGGPIGFEDPEVYFPLPSNDEQRAILDRMQHRRGVVVQGPPGTGKSHTIANLVTHLLAQGKRVLVTSHTERALRVLRDKLPEDVRHLCIALLGSDRQSIRELEGAVEAISNRQGDWSPDRSEQKVQELRSRLHELRSEIAKKRNRLRQISEADSHSIDLGPYRGTSLHIARQLATERDDLGWIPDPIEERHPPLANNEVREYLDLLWTLPSEAEQAAEADLPAPESLTSPDAIGSLFERERHFMEERSQAKIRFGEWVDRLGSFSDAALVEAENAIGAYANEVKALIDASEWARTAVEDVISGRRAVWDALQDDLAAHHTMLDEALKSLGPSTVEIDVELPVSVLKAGTGELIAYAEGGSTIRTGILAMGAARKHREIVEGARVDGSMPLELEQLKTLEAHLTVVNEFDALERAWQGRLGHLDDSTFGQRRAAYAHHKAMLDRALALDELLRTVKDSLDGLWHIPRPDDWTASAALERIAHGLKTERENRELAQVRQAIDDAIRSIGDDSHPTVVCLRQAVRDRSLEDYRAGLTELVETTQLAVQACRRRDLAGALDVVPRLRAELPNSPDDRWRERAELFDRAWIWRYADTALDRLLDPRESRRISGRIEELERKERSTLLELTAELAWAGMFRGLTTEQDQALTAWTHAIRRIGRGTGKYAERHRRTARSYMGMARDAIPAWIMPTYRVAESLEAEPEPFDVVIVDEASQSSVESLFLFYIAKQVIVVGDDQQIAPEAVGIDMMEVARLQRQHLDGVPFKEEFGPTSSLFDQADIRFGNRVVLREHFRCMPEIIEFSNRISYPEKSLWPLRQYGADRLDPVKTVYLEHGYREGKTRAVNRPEAEEIVARIEKLCADPSYNDRTFGVISLQGDAQAHLIDQLLIERLGPQLIAERSIICGDAYAFQGDERNIMFLSMVAAPNERIGALSKAQDRRRFNVAGSRAQDQIWLIHSIKPGELSTTDMRKAMLEYYLDPDVEHWEELAKFDERIVNDPFESRFEQDVYLRLRERGFKVSPQVRAGGYRIDLVVNGPGAKLAVECDGDEWHGSDRWEEDSVRQRRLERAGWHFARVRGSDFYRDPDSALEAVWEACERLGIEPGVSIGGQSHIVEPPITRPKTDGPQDVEQSDAPSVSDSDETVTSELDSDAGSSESLSEATKPREAAVPHLISNPAPLSEDSEASPSREDPSALALGAYVYHPRLGEGRVRAVSREQHPDAPWVRIRFADGEFDYSRMEFLQAGFDEMPPNPGQSTAIAPTYPVTSESGGPSRTSEVGTHQVEVTDRSGLLRYSTWTGGSLPDPRGADRSTIADHLLTMIRAEGPVTTDRLYKLYVKAAGGSRVTKQARRPLNSALFHLASRVTIEEFQSPETNWPQRVVRAPDAPPVVIRALGERELYEVPLNEIAALMTSGRGQSPRISTEDLKRYVLEAYGLVKLTTRADNYLQAAVDLLE